MVEESKAETTRLSAGNTTVAVVVPGYNRAEFTPDEEVSFRHLDTFLVHYDKFLVVPRSLSIRRPGFQLKRFDDTLFGSTIANTKLMLSRQFYESFIDYQYILIYQLDALIFSDQLLDWCATGWDYIGAPWIKCHDSPWVSKSRVGMEASHSETFTVFSESYPPTNIGLILMPTGQGFLRSIQDFLAIFTCLKNFSNI